MTTRLATQRNFMSAVSVNNSAAAAAAAAAVVVTAATVNANANTPSTANVATTIATTTTATPTPTSNTSNANAVSTATAVVELDQQQHLETSVRSVGILNSFEIKDEVFHVEDNNKQHRAAAATAIASPAQHHQHEMEEEDFDFIDEVDEAVVTAAELNDVIAQKLIEGDEGDDETEGVAVISVVMPIDAATDSTASSEHILTTTGNVISGNGAITRRLIGRGSVTDAATGQITNLSAIKDSIDLVQQVANGQLTVLQAEGDDDDGAPQYITVTVSAQDAGQNYQVQYVDTELYHSNSSQTQMTYPFCPVGDYQTNGQTYYSTTPGGSSGYGSGTVPNTPVTHASGGLPYLVPVEEGLLLNTSSQSHSRDSAHSLTEVTYIQETQSTPQTPTSTTTTNSISGGSMGTGGGGASPDSEQSTLVNTNKIASATIKWLSHNYETAEGVSLPRSTLYNHYMQHCNEHKLEPVNAASFGKLIRSVFSGLRTRRLGTRGNSKYHYYGIRIKPGSMLNNQMMDDKPNGDDYATHGGAGSSGNSSGGGGGGGGHHHSAGGTSHGVSPSSSGAGGGNRGKKHPFKPETYESCTQYLGDGVGALPTFPHIELNHTFSSELTQDDVETFRVMYREHCESFLDAVVNLEFNTVEFLWRDFWRAGDNNNLDECEEEKYLSKTKLYLLCHCAEVQKFIMEVDYQFYQNLVDVIIPDVLRSIPNTLTQAIRNFSKNLELWLCETMVGVPERLVQTKSAAVSAFCQTLRRYTSLNHLAQAARAVLQNGTQIAQMLSDLNRVDFHNVQEQAAWVCQCEPAVVQRLENDFKTALQQQNSLEQWASWLQMVVDSALQEYRGKPTYTKAARQFLLKWSFYSSMVIRDLTLRSASSFGSFHLIRLLYDEYMFYLIEHKIADAQQKTAIAVICERMHKEINFEFDYPLEYLGEANETTQDGSIAKRLKHE